VSYVGIGRSGYVKIPIVLLYAFRTLCPTISSDLSVFLIDYALVKQSIDHPSHGVSISNAFSFSSCASSASYAWWISHR
jgi:hypothetical protein